MNNIKERIVSVLRKNPKGLTISKIAEQVGIHRTTIPKYLYELRGEKKVLIRDIGPARVFYLNTKFTKRIDEDTIIRRLRSAM